MSMTVFLEMIRKRKNKRWWKMIKKLFVLCSILLAIILSIYLWGVYQGYKYHKVADAIEGGDLESVKQLIGNEYSFNDKYYNFSLLRNAVLKDRLDILQLLIEKGAEINKLDASGIAPLHLACYMGNVEIVEFLLHKGANPNLHTNDNKDCFLSLLKLPDEKAAKITEIIIKSGFNVNKLRSDTGYIPIMDAVLEKKNKLKGVLLKYTDLVKNDELKLPLAIFATFHDDVELLQSCLERGETVNVRSKKGIPILHFAAGLKARRTLKLIIKKGADLNIMDKRGNAVLHQDMVTNNIEIVDLLIKAGASINTQNKYGATPLIEAVKNGKIDVVEILLKNNADINIKDNSGKTASDYALDKGYKDIYNLLKV